MKLPEFRKSPSQILPCRRSPGLPTERRYPELQSSRYRPVEIGRIGQWSHRLPLGSGVGPADRSERKVSSFVALQDVAGRPIRALRFSILAGSDNTSLRTGDDSQARDRWIVLYPESKSAIEAADKGQIYQIARGNQTIRNLMP